LSSFIFYGGKLPLNNLHKIVNNPCEWDGNVNVWELSSEEGMNGRCVGAGWMDDEWKCTLKCKK
jgi:hypothetical protein